MWEAMHCNECLAGPKLKKVICFCKVNFINFKIKVFIFLY